MNIILLGPPGSGKGTQATAIMNKTHLKHLAPGDIFRKEIEHKTELGKQVEEYIDRGDLVPDHITIHIIKNILQKGDGFLFDGYPRDLEQAEALETMLSELNKKVNLVIDIQISDKEVIRRISGRRVNVETGATYHIEFNPPPEGEKVIQRDDDTEQAVQVRLKNYHKLTEPLINYYKEQGVLIEINGEQSIEEVTQNILKLLEQ